MFQAFSQTKGLFETLTGDEPAPTRPTMLGNDPTDVQRAAQNTGGRLITSRNARTHSCPTLQWFSIPPA